MASMGNMPDTAWNVMSLCSCYLVLYIVLFSPKKRNIGPF